YVGPCPCPLAPHAYAAPRALRSLPTRRSSDLLPAPVEWSARIYVRTPEEVAGELQRQMNKVRSQVKHYTDEHDLEPPQSLARQRSEEHTSELQSRENLVCRLLLEKKKPNTSAT